LPDDQNGVKALSVSRYDWLLGATMHHSEAQRAAVATICWVFLFRRCRDSFVPLWVAKAEGK
jgi:hypothetical protein